jgi:hypothetical protein
MNLTLHQFRKDVRQFRVLLLVWMLLLISSMAANLGWVGGVSHGLEQGADNAGLVWVGAQTAFVWALYFLLPASVVLADSPARREGFLRTRPLPGRDLLRAKALFILALVVLPALLQEAIYLTVAGLSPGQVLRGVAERLLFALPFVAISAAFASLWPGFAKWSRALGIVLVLAYLPLMLWSLLWFVLHQPGELMRGSSVPAESRALAALYVLAAATMILAILHARRDWNAPARWVGVAGCILLYGLVNLWWPVNFFPRQPADPAAARAVIRRFPLNAPMQSLSLRKLFDQQGDDRLDFVVQLIPRTNPAVFPDIIEWNGQNTKLVNAAGQNVTPVRPPASASWQYYWVPPARYLKAWSRFLPPEALFRLGQSMNPPGDATDLGQFKLDTHAAWLGEPATFSARLQAGVYRWSQVADFPLTHSASLTDAYGAWRYFGWHPDGPIPDRHHVLLQRSQISFTTTGDERATGFQNYPAERYGFVLYSPARNLALVPENPYNIATSRATATALAQYWLDLIFDTRSGDALKPLAPDEIGECHLLIFQKTWLGNVPVDWQSPPLVIRDMLDAPVASSPNNQNGLSAEEVRRRLAAIPLPGPAASRLEVGHYLLQVVSIMNDSRYWQPPGDAAVARLASLAPDHLDVLLDALPVLQGPAYNAVQQAILRGTTEAQKTRIIAAMPADQDLMPVILQRGWVVDARGAINQLMAEGKPLTYPVIQAIVSLQDPATYPRLLAEFTANPTTEVYDLLHRLPGLAGSVEEVLASEWGNRNPMIATQPGLSGLDLGLALHTGNPEALKMAFRWLAETKPTENPGSDNWDLAQCFRQNVYLSPKLPDGSQSEDNILAAMRHYGPDDFRFDPIRQRFVLKL